MTVMTELGVFELVVERDAVLVGVCEAVIHGLLENVAPPGVGVPVGRKEEGVMRGEREEEGEKEWDGEEDK